MKNPDMVLAIHGDADTVAQDPMVRQRLRPHRIYFEHRRLDGGGFDHSLLPQKRRSDSESDSSCEQTRRYAEITLHTDQSPFYAQIPRSYRMSSGSLEASG